jgi:hypothetical protein
MFSEPVAGERFFGRDEILDILNKRVLALKDGYRQNVALTGQSLSGKSSVILHFLSTIKDEAFVPVYVEVVNEPFSSFANKFIATMLYNAVRMKGEEAPSSLDGLISMAQGLIPRTAAAVKHVYALMERGELESAYSAVLESTSVLKSEIGAPCIVILDEFDNLEKLGIRNPFQAFGKVIMVQKDTMYIVSSSRNLAIKRIISEKLSLLFGNFEVVKVSNFGIKASRDFLASRLGAFEIDDFVRTFLIAFTDGNPFYLNTIVSRIRDEALRRMTSFIDRDMLAEVIIELIYNSNGTLHQYLMNYILELVETKNRDVHIPILIAMACGMKKHPDIARSLKIRQRDVLESLGQLSEAGLLSKNGAFHSLEDSMLGFWLKHVYHRKKNMLIDGIFDKTAVFRREIEEYMGSFAEEYAMTVTSRVARLFNLFSNEIVQIESRGTRLPHFTKVEALSFPDSSGYVLASFRGNSWITQVFERQMNENDIVSFIRNVKGLGSKISNKLIVPLRGMDENAKLLAKELKITIWDSRALNTLLDLYGLKKVIIS